MIGGFSFTSQTFAVSEDVLFNSLEEFVQMKYPLKLAVDRMGTTDEWSLRNTLKLLGVTYAESVSTVEWRFPGRLGDGELAVSPRRITSICAGGPSRLISCG